MLRILCHLHNCNSSINQNNSIVLWSHECSHKMRMHHVEIQRVNFGSLTFYKIEPA